MSEEGADLQGEVSPEETGDDVIEESSTSESEEPPAEPEGPKEPKGVQKRINELTANWREEQRQREQLQNQLFELQRQMLDRKEPEAPKEQPSPRVEPKVEDFSTYEEFMDARADWRAEQKFTEQIQAWEAQQQTKAQAESFAERQREFDAKAASFAESHPDFDTVARNPRLPVTQDMAEVLNISEKGPEVLYHLGQNPAEAARIAQLPAAQVGLELGRIEAQLSALQPNTQTGAPSPIEPLTDGSGSTRAKDPDQMSMSEWVEWRNSQLEK